MRNPKPPAPPWKRNKYAVNLGSFSPNNTGCCLEDASQKRELSFQSGVQLLSVLAPKMGELIGTDSLPDTIHGVKEERQIVMGQKDAGEHLAR